jgi:AAA domain
MAATAPQPMDYAALQPDEAAARINGHSALRATPYRWPDPASLPRRQWLMGHWLLRGEVTAIIAPGGTGKSTIGNTMALCLASGRPLLGKPLHRGPLGVWVYNLEDGTDELERQMAAASAFHGIGPDDCGDRLYLDSGLAQPLCTANQDRDGYTLAEEVFAQLAATICDQRIGAVIVDPFVSSHGVQESSNEAMDAILKRWKRLAQDTGCAVVLVHHTRKLGGREVTAEDGRGAVALRDAARVVLPLNPMGDKEAEELGIADPALRRSLVRIDTGKANRAPPDAATWIKLESQSLDNGDGLKPADFVGVATLWEKPDVFHGLTTWHLYMVQQGIAAGDWRESVQAKDWVGHLVASVAGLSAEADKGRIKAIIRTWRKNGALAVETRPDKNGDERPFVIVGDPVDASQISSRPHLEKCGVESAESAGADPC